MTKEDYKRKERQNSTNFLMKLRARTILSTGALLLAGAYLLFSFLGPSGVPMVLDKSRQIRMLQEQNANLQRDIEQSRARIKGLAENPSEQERHVREDLKLLKKNETTFVIQDQNR